jgi:hypothetical protein
MLCGRIFGGALSAPAQKDSGRLRWTPPAKSNGLGKLVVDGELANPGTSPTTLKRNVLDSIARAIGALDDELIPALRVQPEDPAAARLPPSSAGGPRRSIRRRSQGRAGALSRPARRLPDTRRPCAPGRQMMAILLLRRSSGMVTLETSGAPRVTPRSWIRHDAGRPRWR